MKLSNHIGLACMVFLVVKERRKDYKVEI